MSSVSVFCGDRRHGSLDSWLSALTSAPAWRPFDDRAIAFVGRFSRRLLTHARIREFPELAALGHWFRPARLRDLAQQSAQHRRDDYTVGRGFAFHLAPANVDAVSMYSWLLSLLAGNTNLVRVSQRVGPQLDFVFSLLEELLDEEVGVPIASRIVLLTYPHDAEITARISAQCQVRVVWGGDATVAEIRGIPLRPTATELVFPDRFSLVALRASRVADIGDVDLRALAARFCNDAFWFAQQACSSPRVVYWVGTTAECDVARARFWDAVRQELAQRAFEDTPAMAMSRMEAAFLMAAGEAVHPSEGLVPSAPLRLSLERGLPDLVKTVHPGNGLFLEDRIPTLEALATVLSDREQTLAVFGFEQAEADRLLNAIPARALDRIVPVGRALEFDATWDGTDLLTSFTRRIVVQLS